MPILELESWEVGELGVEELELRNCCKLMCYQCVAFCNVIVVAGIMLSLSQILVSKLFYFDLNSSRFAVSTCA